MKKTMEQIVKELSQPFPEDRIRWRIGRKTKKGDKAAMLAYIDARDLMDRLDDVVGPGGWKSKHYTCANQVACKISIKNPETGEWISKTDGAGATAVEGEKGMMSDALKRAGVSWGIARYLYDFGDVWVRHDENGGYTEWGKGILDNPWTKLRRKEKVGTIKTIDDIDVQWQKIETALAVHKTQEDLDAHVERIKQHYLSKEDVDVTESDAFKAIYDTLSKAIEGLKGE